MAVMVCENCERPFCYTCDEDSGTCARCGRPYCGECCRQGEICPCMTTIEDPRWPDIED